MDNPTQTSIEKTAYASYKGIRLGGYFLSLVSLGIACYMLFFTNVLELQVQALQWFILALVIGVVPSIIPYVQLIKVKDIEFHLQQARQLEASAKEREKHAIEKEISGNIAVMKTYQYLNAESLDITPDDEETIKKYIINAPLIAIPTIYASASTYRMNLVYRMLEATDQTNIDGYRKRQEKLIPIFEALLQSSSDPASKHDYHAQLAYLYKDKLSPEWDKAYFNINRAIEIRDEYDQGNIKLTIYEFNRLVTGLNAYQGNLAQLNRLQGQFEKDFDAVYADTSTRYMLFETEEILAPRLLDWVKRHRLNEYHQWSAHKPNKQHSG